MRGNKRKSEPFLTIGSCGIDVVAAHSPHCILHTLHYSIGSWSLVILPVTNTRLHGIVPGGGVGVLEPPGLGGGGHLLPLLHLLDAAQHEDTLHMARSYSDFQFLNLL